MKISDLMDKFKAKEKAETQGLDYTDEFDRQKINGIRESIRLEFNAAVDEFYRDEIAKREPEPPEVQKLVAKYIDSQTEEAKKCGREKFDNRLASHYNALQLVDRVRWMIADKNYNPLQDWLHTGNPFMKRLFTALTGIKLPPTDKGTFQILRDFCGEESYTAHVQAKERAKAARDEEGNRQRMAEITKRLERKMAYCGNGPLESVKAIIDRMIDEENATIEIDGAGRHAKYWLRRASDKRAILLTNADEKQYATARIAAQALAALNEEYPADIDKGEK